MLVCDQKRDRTLILEENGTPGKNGYAGLLTSDGTCVSDLRSMAPLPVGFLRGAGLGLQRAVPGTADCSSRSCPFCVFCLPEESPGRSGGRGVEETKGLLVPAAGGARHAFADLSRSH